MITVSRDLQVQINDENCVRNCPKDHPRSVPCFWTLVLRHRAQRTLMYWPWPKSC